MSYPSYEDLKAMSVGPIGSSLVVAAPDPPDVFFKVRWDARLKRVRKAAEKAETEGLDCVTRWANLGSGVAFLKVQWPQVDVDITLMFDPPSRWRHELQYILANPVVTLVPPGPINLTQALAFEVETSLLDTIVAACFMK